MTGQIHETVGPIEGADPLEHYLRVVGDKTGSLIATSGRFGAMLSGADDGTTAECSPSSVSASAWPSSSPTTCSTC